MYIYIVDDDESFGRSLKRLLNTTRISAEYFSSAQEFLDSVPHDQADAVAVIDLQMPDCDGLSLMEKMQAANYRMPVVMMTGHAKPNSEKLALQRGAIGFLHKPFTEKAFLDLITARGQYRRS